MSSRGRGIRLTEAVKDEREKLGADALPGITNTYLKGCVSSFNSNFSPASGRSEFDRIGDEIPNHLLQAAGIAHRMASRRIERHLQLNSFGVSRQLHGINSRVDDRGHI